MEKKIKEIDYERITTTPQLHKHRFLCFLFGHKKAVPMLNETDWAIFTKVAHVAEPQVCLQLGKDVHHHQIQTKIS